MGCPAGPRRVAQARLPGGSVDRGQVHGQTPWSTVTGLEDLPAYPCRRYRSHRPFRSPDSQLPPTLRPDHHPFGPSPAGVHRRDGQSHGRMGGTAGYRGISLGRCAKIPHPRSRPYLWHGVQAPPPSNGHPRPSDCAKVALAESLRRAIDRLDPARMPRPFGGHGSRTPAPDPAILCDLLQPGSHAPIAEQGLPDPSTHSGARSNRLSADPRRSASRKASGSWPRRGTNRDPWCH